MTVADLPLVNATLNGVAAVLLVAGLVLIKRGRREAHRRAMQAAFATSVLFLASYVVYHANVGSRPFTGQGPVRVLYFAILLSHVILAAVVPPLAGLTLWRGLQGRFDRHTRLARWTLPIWLYVSVTGIVVYLMLYQLY